MKLFDKDRLIALVVSSAILAASAFAAVPFSGSISDVRAARLTRNMNRLNKQACANVGLPAGCTQAQAREANPEAVIYRDLSDYIERGIVQGYADQLKATDQDDDWRQAAQAWAAKTAAEKDAVCAAFSLPNGCEVFPR